MPTINVRWADNTKDLKRNLQEGVGSIEATKASVEKLVQALAGDKLVASAHRWTAAIREFGPVSTLAAADATRAFGTITKAIETLERQGKPVPAQMRALADELKAVQPHASALDGWVKSLGTSIVGTAAGFVSAQAILAAFRGVVSGVSAELKTLTLHGAEVGDVTENFERLTAQAGHLGSTLLGTLRAGTHSTITDFELMKTVNQDLAAGMRLTDAQFGTLSKGAFALAQATGGSVKTALDTMNDAMLTGRTRALALLTGKIDLEAAETKYAASLGTTRDHLSEEGKLEAARMSILDGVSAATARLGDQTDGLDERVAQLSVTWKNFEDALGRAIATSPVLETALSTIKDDLVGAFGGDQAALVDALSKKFDDVAIALISVGRAGISVGGFFVTEFTAAAKVVGNLAQVLDGVRLAALLARQVTGGGFFDKTLDEQISRLELSMKQRGDSLKALDAVQKGVAGTTKELNATLDELEQKMKDARDAHVAFMGPVQDVAAAERSAADAAADRAGKIKQSTEEISKAKAAYVKWAEATRAIDAASGGYVKTLETVNHMTRLRVQYLLEQGASEADIATALHLTEEQVKAVAKAMEADTSILKLNATATTDLEAALKNVGTVYDKEIPRLQVLYTWRKKLYDLERSAAAAVKFEDATPAQVLPDDVLKDLAEAEKRTKAFDDALSDLSGAFAELAQISGDSWGGALQNIGKVIASVNVMQTAMKTLNDTIAKDGSAAWGQYAAAGASAFSALLVGYGLILDSIEKDRAANHAAFVERSRMYASFAERRNEFRLTISTEDLAELDRKLAKFFLLSPRWDRDAYDAMMKEIEADLSRLEKISGGARARFGPSKTELKEMAQDAHDIFDFMLEQNKGKAEKDWEFTQDQLTAAFMAYQEALAAAGDEAAKAWLKAHKGAEAAATAGSKALDELKAKRDTLAGEIAKEAPEEVMGVIETQMRRELAAIDDEITKAQAALETGAEKAAGDMAEEVGGAGTKMANDMGVTAETIEELLRTAGVDAATATEIAMGEAGTNMGNDMGVTADEIEDLLRSAGENAARAMERTFAEIDIPDVHVKIVWDVPDLPGGTDGGGDGTGGDFAPTLAMMTPKSWALPASSSSLSLAGSGAGRLTRTGGGSDRPIQITVQTLLDGQLVAENIIQRAKHDKHGVGTKLRRIVGV